MAAAYDSASRAEAALGLDVPDLDPATGWARLSYEMAEQLFKEHSGGKAPHHLRHSGSPTSATRTLARPC